MKIFILLIVGYLATKEELYAAEAGMPQLDPEFWASQAFWLVLVFTSLYLAISKLFIPKIKNNLDNRDNKIKNDLDEAKNLEETAEKKQKEYELIIDSAHKDVFKILLENKNKLNLDIQTKKKKFEKDIEKEIEKAQNEILDLKKNSLIDIAKISEEIASNIIEKISGDKLNGSSIKAAITESSKKIGSYL